METVIAGTQMSEPSTNVDEWSTQQQLEEGRSTGDTIHVKETSRQQFNSTCTLKATLSEIVESKIRIGDVNHQENAYPEVANSCLQACDQSGTWKLCAATKIVGQCRRSGGVERGWSFGTG